MLQDYNLEHVLSKIHDNINTAIKQAMEKKNKVTILHLPYLEAFSANYHASSFP